VLSDATGLRHEAGHFAGLFHTSEFAPGYGDPLSDTPQCDDPATLLETCPDFGNAMFPGGLSTPGTLSPLQVRVVQASALYRGVYAPGEEPMEPSPSASTAKWSKGQAALTTDVSAALPNRRLDLRDHPSPALRDASQSPLRHHTARLRCGAAGRGLRR
jgi:hypothetical protein